MACSARLCFAGVGWGACAALVVRVPSAALSLEPWCRALYRPLLVRVSCRLPVVCACVCGLPSVGWVRRVCVRMQWVASCVRIRAIVCCRASAHVGLVLSMPALLVVLRALGFVRRDALGFQVPPAPLRVRVPCPQLVLVRAFRVPPSLLASLLPHAWASGGQPGLCSELLFRVCRVCGAYVTVCWCVCLLSCALSPAFAWLACVDSLSLLLGAVLVW